MREVEEQRAAREFLRRPPDTEAGVIQCSDATNIDLGAHCTIVGGRNGVGKSRLLRRIRDEVGVEGAIYIDLHALADRALSVHGARTDSEQMFDEFEPMILSGDRLADVSRIVGRDYDRVEWFSLDVLPGDEEVASDFMWGGDEPVVPYFRVSYRGREYASADMGLGEYSVHMLFWALEQLRERQGLLILLDEPDAFLPPVGVGALLGRLARICATRRWRLVIASHSEELIRLGVDADAFVLAELGSDGETKVTHSRDDASAWRGLLSPSAIDTVIFCEDESAHHLIRATLREHDPALHERSQVLWGGGSGYLTGLRKHLPTVRDARIRHAFVYDGDQRQRVDDSGYPANFLPGSGDPDSMFREARSAPEALAHALQRDVSEIQRVLERLEGCDAHDWVNRLAEHYGRTHTLEVLATLWVRNNSSDAAGFAADLISKISG